MSIEDIKANLIATPPSTAPVNPHFPNQNQVRRLCNPFKPLCNPFATPLQTPVKPLCKPLDFVKTNVLEDIVFANPLILRVPRQNTATLCTPTSTNV
jgi:hypothetical protein